MLVYPLLGGTVGDPDGSFVMAEWTDPGCPPEGPMPIAPLHVHRDCDEAWYVLEGTLCVQVGDEKHVAMAGAAVFGPKGIPHTFWNPNPEPARYLLVMTRKTFQLIQAFHALTDRDPMTIRKLFADYGVDLLI